MSKFEELRGAYIAARNAYFARRQAAITLAGVLARGLESFLQVPQFHLQFIPSTGDSSSSKAGTAETAVWLAPDERWHFRLGLPLSDRTLGTAKGGSTQTLVLEFHAVPKGDWFEVGLKDRPDRFSLPVTAAAAEHLPFFEYLFGQMEAVYRQPGLKFYDNMADTTRSVTG
jgi:hypothetical protein